ncbi:MAG TPA: IS701 family transposase [Ktedonobacterales bacterium]|jgi:SRSO17 transposase
MTQARAPATTVAYVGDYCAQYRDLFSDVREFEQFTLLHVGLLAETKRKSLPRIAKTVHADAQALHHFLTTTHWSTEALRARRLELLRQALRETPFILCIDETGDRKKGHTTDYVAHQYIGNVHTLANGIVSVNAYGVLDGVTFPLAFALYKPKSRLKPGDVYHSKPQLAVALVQQLAALGFHFSVVLADSMYGESYDFTSAISRLGVPYVVAIRSNHGVWTAKGERQRQTRWRAFDRTFSDGTTERRYRQELIFGRRMRVRFFCITTDPVHLPPETTWLLMTTLPERAEQMVGDLFGARTWIEYGFRQSKDELGWADYRVTDAESIERWWELVMSAYLLVSLQSPVFAALGTTQTTSPAVPLETHPAWNAETGWKHLLNNLRLLLQPLVCASLLLPWLQLVPLPHLRAGLHDLCALMNTVHLAFLK